jgi:N-acetyl-anhydromuramyl-L-alanine amidase AmpD
MVKINKILSSNGIKTDEIKKNIILIDTKRFFDEYVNSLEYRLNKKNTMIPHYLIRQDGEVFQFLEENEGSDISYDLTEDYTGIVIALENLGWLDRLPLSSHYINWIGSIYKKKVFERKWRDCLFWHTYTDEQYISLADLCKEIFNTSKINNRCVGHNVKVTGVSQYEGIISRSNFSERYTDVNPAFDFDKFNELLNEEKKRVRRIKKPIEGIVKDDE